MPDDFLHVNEFSGVVLCEYGEDEKSENCQQVIRPHFNNKYLCPKQQININLHNNNHNISITHAIMS